MSVARGATTEGLARQRPGAGEEINGVHSADGGADEVEEGLAHAVLHRPYTRVAAVLEAPAAELSAHDPQPDGRCGASARRRMWEIPVVLRPLARCTLRPDGRQGPDKPPVLW